MSYKLFRLYCSNHSSGCIKHYHFFLCSTIQKYDCLNNFDKGHFRQGKKYACMSSIYTQYIFIVAIMVHKIWVLENFGSSIRISLFRILGKN